jgi:Domain of unknown function (DUF6285)
MRMMRDLPEGADLLFLAREILLDELLPLLPEDARVKTRLVATCMAIAAREAAAGDEPLGEIRGALEAFYSRKGFAAEGAPHPLAARVRERGEGGGEGLRGRNSELLRRFALDLRKGAFETSQSQERAARAILWQMTIAKLREGNPGCLAANGIAGS